MCGGGWPGPYSLIGVGVRVEAAVAMEALGMGSKSSPGKVALFAI